MEEKSLCSIFLMRVGRRVGGEVNVLFCRGEIRGGKHVLDSLLHTCRVEIETSGSARRLDGTPCLVGGGGAKGGGGG